MSAVIFGISFIFFILFKQNWKKLLYLFLFTLPYLGYLQLQLKQSTVLAPAIHDIIFILPIYLIFFLYKNNLNILPNSLRSLIYIFIIIILIQFVNPLNNLNLISRLISFKVWLFYLFFIYIGYYLISNRDELKKFCNFFSFVSVIPCLIGILLYFLILIYGYQEVMTAFYRDYNIAQSSTQNFAQFNYENLKLFRIPSTFTFVSQYQNFLMIALVPSIASVNFSINYSEKKIYKFILGLIIIALILSGARSSIIYLSIIFIVFYFNYFGLKGIKNLFTKLLFLLFVLIIFYYNFNFLNSTFNLTLMYTKDYFFLGFIDNLYKYFFGNGLGGATAGARYFDNTINLLHESYYNKAIFELGFFGFFVVLMLFITYLKEINNIKKKWQNKKKQLFALYILPMYFTNFWQL